MKKQLKTDLDTYAYMFKDGEYKISNKGRLFLWTEDDRIEDWRRWGSLAEDEELVDGVEIGDSYHTTSRIRQFMEEFYPQVDFDDEFETHRAGVFERFGQSPYSHNNMETWEEYVVLEELIAALEEKGYGVDVLRAQLDSLRDGVKKIREEIEAEDIDKIELDLLEEQKRQLEAKITEKRKSMIRAVGKEEKKRSVENDSKHAVNRNSPRMRGK